MQNDNFFSNFRYLFHIDTNVLVACQPDVKHLALSRLLLSYRVFVLDSTEFEKKAFCSKMSLMGHRAFLLSCIHGYRTFLLRPKHEPREF